jgi:large subunit ribosomal protein L14
MVGLKTIFNVTDNSGAVIVQCIKILNSHNQSATIGSFVVVAVNKVKIRKKMKVKNHNVYFGLIVRTKQPLNRFNGIKVFFHDNSVVLLDKKKKPYI